MNIRNVLVTLASVGALASQAKAETLAAEGSDTLYQVVQDVLARGAACGGGNGLTYRGGGSGNGETAIRNELTTPAANLQVVAPMSRALKTSVCTATGATATAQGVNFALDGLSVLRSTAQYVNCGGVAAAGDSFAVTERNGVADIQPAGYTDTYTFAQSGTGASAIGAWGDALRIVYGGLHNNGVRDCGSDVRRSLLAQWSALFAGECNASEGCTGGVKHAFRRGDLSGTSDTFAALLGLGSATTAATWCNGTERQDRDPVRVSCDSLDDVCQACANATNTSCSTDPLQRGLGTVVAIRVPEDVALAPVVQKRNPCVAGLYKLAPRDSFSQSSGVCPNGGSPVGTQCWAPTDANGEFGCIASGNSWPGGTPSAIRLNGTARVYNRTLRNASGSVPAEGTNLYSGWFRLRSRVANANACLEPDATRQIACLVSRDPCNIGFAGREAAEITTYNTQGLLVNNVAATPANIRKLVQTPVPADVYPLSRKLWVNTLRGVANIEAAGARPEQAKFLACMQDRSIIDPIVTANGFVTLDDNGTSVSIVSGADVCIAP